LSLNSPNRKLNRKKRMKMLDKINKAQRLINNICKGFDRQINIMEVCGTHTVSIFRNGIRDFLPDNLKLLSGPGCPVCVTDQSYIDTTIELAQRDDCLIATYGDMVRVPGTNGSLETRNKANVKVILSSDDALQLAKDNPDKEVVFAAVGFETTTPATAVAVNEAQHQGVENFSVLSAHKLVIPAIEALLTEKNNKIDAFLCPGHVSVIIGSDAYQPIAANYKKPCVVAGFEAIQIIESIAQICQQLAENTPVVSSLYDAAVTAEGNRAAQKITSEMFDVADTPWRGLGTIAKSGLVLKDKFGKFDTLKRFGITPTKAVEPTGCRCGEILCGLIEPMDCPLFEKKCTPDEPVGACMVSSEGTCAAWYKYGRRRKQTK